MVGFLGQFIWGGGDKVQDHTGSTLVCSFVVLCLKKNAGVQRKCRVRGLVIKGGGVFGKGGGTLQEPGCFGELLKKKTTKNVAFVGTTFLDKEWTP